jgi:hypothetical protein
MHPICLLFPEITNFIFEVHQLNGLFIEPAYNFTAKKYSVASMTIAF